MTPADPFRHTTKLQGLRSAADRGVQGSAQPGADALQSALAETTVTGS